jgi:prolipoprotein diacylglyceryltransferase
VPWPGLYARPHLGRNGRFPTYSTLGFVGGVAGISAATALGARAGQSPSSLLIVASVPALSFVAAALITRVVLAETRLVLYESFALALGATAAALHLAGDSIAAGLDLVAIELGLFLVLGRLGCLHAGCCHGRPHRFGIIYGREYRHRVPWYYLGIPLFPVQLLESITTLALVSACIALQVRPHAPGEVLAAYALGYAVLRFGLELLRGDDARPFAGGISEAQWIAVVSAGVIATLAMRADHTYAGIALAIAVSLAAGAACVAIAYRLLPGWHDPARVRRLADAALRKRLEDSVAGAEDVGLVVVEAHVGGAFLAGAIEGGAREAQ